MREKETAIQRKIERENRYRTEREREPIQYQEKTENNSEKKIESGTPKRRERK